LVKVKALVAKDYEDDVTSLDMESVADTLLANAVNAPGTSHRPTTASGRATAPNRPMTQTGRPSTGYARPGTSAGRKATSFSDDGHRPVTARPASMGGRFVRLGTASLGHQGTNSDPSFIAVQSLDLERYQSRPNLAKALFEYLFYVEKNYGKAQELAALCCGARIARSGMDKDDYPNSSSSSSSSPTRNVSEGSKGNKDSWIWRARLGKCCYHLGMYNEAEREFRTANDQQPAVSTFLELGKVYLKLKQPNAAKATYEDGLKKFREESSLWVALARLEEFKGDLNASAELYRKVLDIDNGNVEAIACLASHFFYMDQPEMALRFYRRLVQMGLNSVEVWNNMALCCFYSQQYDMTLGCFERALAMASDDTMPDVWYNVSQVALAIGDAALANQALKITLSLNPNHAEANNNLGVLHARQGDLETARTHFLTAKRQNPHVFEASFNAAVVCFKLHAFAEAYQHAKFATYSNWGIPEAKAVLEQLRVKFESLL